MLHQRPPSYLTPCLHWCLYILTLFVILDELLMFPAKAKLSSYATDPILSSLRPSNKFPISLLHHQLSPLFWVILISIVTYCYFSQLKNKQNSMTSSSDFFLFLLAAKLQKELSILVVSNFSSILSWIRSKQVFNPTLHSKHSYQDH